MREPKVREIVRSELQAIMRDNEGWRNFAKAAGIPPHKRIRFVRDVMAIPLHSSFADMLSEIVYLIDAYREQS